MALVHQLVIRGAAASDSRILEPLKHTRCCCSLCIMMRVLRSCEVVVNYSHVGYKKIVSHGISAYIYGHEGIDYKESLAWFTKNLGPTDQKISS